MNVKKKRRRENEKHNQPRINEQRDLQRICTGIDQECGFRNTGYWRASDASLMESEVQSCSNDFDYDWLCNHGWVSFSDRLTGEKEFRVKALSSVTERMRMYDEAKSVMVDNTLNISNEIFDAFAEAALKQAVSKEIGLSELVMAVIDANIQNLGDGALFKMASFMERSIQPTGNNNDDDWVYSHGWTEFSNHLIHEKENRKASFHAEKEFTSDSEEYPDVFLSGGEDSYE